jgi:uncharacterized protein (TIGR02996 family)
MSKSDRAVFLEAIRADPADATARMVYADWLDEQGDPYGEVVRLLCEVQREAYADTPAWQRLERVVGGLRTVIEPLAVRDRHLLACDYAERVLHVFEHVSPKDRRPRQAVETIRRYALGRATAEELGVARGGVVGAKAAAGTVAAWAAALAVQCATRSATRKAAKEARGAIGASRGAGWAEKAAERRWQLCRAVEYRLGFVPPPLFEKE